jgi:hypothetical protein
MTSGTFGTVDERKKYLDVYFNGIRLAYNDDYEVLSMHSLALTFDSGPSDRIYLTIYDSIGYP